MFTLLDVDWSAFQLASLAVAAVIVDRLGVEPLYWLGGSLLAAAGLLGLWLFHDARFVGRSPS